MNGEQNLDIQIHDSGEIVIVFPIIIFHWKMKMNDYLKRQSSVKNYHFNDESSRISLSITVDRAINPHWFVRQMFIHVHQLPELDPTPTDTFQNADRPLVSCIILLTANDLFVSQVLIPSLIQSSQDRAIEIIVISNGIDCDLNLFKDYSVYSSELCCVSKAYNLGAKMAKGKYLAFFHDDCYLADRTWIDQCIRGLEAGYAAVTSELENQYSIGPHAPLITAKNVPLFIEKATFFALGGYDETYYIGFEDVDFTYKMQSEEKKFMVCDLNYMHFNGMSTVLIFGQRRSHYKKLFSYLMLNKKSIILLRNLCLRKMAKHRALEKIHDLQAYYLLKKFCFYWQETNFSEALFYLKHLEDSVAEDPQDVLLNERSDLIKLISQYANS